VVNALGLNDNVVDARYLVTFHTLRHTYASWLVMRGAPLYTVQRLLGHQTSAMTERYSHLAPDHLRETVKGFEEGLREHKEKSDTGVSIIN
jgi:site-specific recombinase XerD